MMRVTSNRDKNYELIKSKIMLLIQNLYELGIEQRRSQNYYNRDEVKHLIQKLNNMIEFQSEDITMDLIRNSMLDAVVDIDNLENLENPKDYYLGINEGINRCVAILNKLEGIEE